MVPLTDIITIMVVYNDEDFYDYHLYDKGGESG